VVGRIAWQRRLADEIDSYVNALHGDAGNELGAQLPTGANPRFFVFNPLGWQRTDVADFAWSGSTNVHVVDVAAQVEVPSQLLMIAGQVTLRIQARNLPAVGYGVYEVVSGPGTFAACGTITGTGDLVLDNGVHTVRVTATGAITSLVDHGQQNREFARSVNGLWLNDLGGATGGSVVVGSAGPVSLSVIAQCNLPVPHTTTVTLYRDGDRVEVQDTIDANFTNTQTWSFGLNLDNPDVHHEEVGAVLHARVTPAGDYAARTARYDWLSLGHFADMVTAGGVGVTLSNRDCGFFKLGNSTNSSLDVGTPLLAVLAGGTQLGSPTGGLPAQGGDSSFLHRFALRTHSGYDPAAAMRTALEHQNPLVTGQVTGTNVQWPVGPLGMISISDPNVLLWTLKPAEEGLGQGLIVRLWNVTSQPRTANVALLQDALRSAFETTHIETNVASLPVSSGSVAVSFQPQQLRTLRLRSDIAAIATYGSGCPGFNGAATLLSVGDSLPSLGQNFDIEVRPVAAGVLPVLTVGFGNTSSPFGPLPLDLGFAGMPGCSLLVNPLLNAPVLPQNGVASLTLAVPSSSSLIGADVFLQAALLPPLANQAIGVTAGLQARVGR
jgi:alpha-mannosidase